MAFCNKILIVALCLSLNIAKCQSQTQNSTAVKEPRQMEYISLIGTLLQQTTVLSSVDGALLAASTVAAALLARARPVLLAGFMSYLLYAGTALVAPGAAARMGIVPHRGARSVAGGVVAEALMRSIQISPVMSIVTNVSVSVISDAAARVRGLARSLGQQLRWIQGRMTTFSASLQSSCVEKFLCRVGRFTQDAFPTAAMALRTIGNNAPGLDSFAVAMVRGTSSSNCSLIYPDCII